MRDIEGLTRIRADVSPPSAEAWASARSAVLNAFNNEQTDEHATRVIAFPDAARRSCDGPRARFTLRIVAAAVIAIVAVGGAVAFGVEHGRSSGDHDASTLGGDSSVRLTGATLRLANYKFKLPAGFKTVSAPCVATPRSTPGSPMTVLGGFSAAAAADGGCIEAALVAGSYHGPPALAQSVQLGSYQGFLSITAIRVTNLALADSALHAPQAGWGDTDLYPDFVDKAAVLVTRLTNNRPLPDGNKRAAWWRSGSLSN